MLATEATALVHGRAAAEAAAGTARQTFEEGTLAASLPTVDIARVELEAGLGVLTAFAEKAQLVASNGEARRQIKAAGLKVNDITVTDDKAVLTPGDLTARRRDQAVARQEAPRAAAAGVAKLSPARLCGAGRRACRFRGLRCVSLRCGRGLPARPYARPSKQSS